MTKIFNRSAALSEAARLTREIQKYDPAFKPSPLSLSVGRYNAEIDALTAQLAAAKTGQRTTTSKGASAKPAAAATGAWGHIHDPELREMLTKEMPGGPKQLAATIATPTPAPDTRAGNTANRAEFNAMSERQRAQFVKAGGRVTDLSRAQFDALSEDDQAAYRATGSRIVEPK